MGAFIKVIGRRSNTKKVTSYVLDKVEDSELLVTGLYCDNDMNSIEQMKATREYFGHNRKISKDSARKSTEVFHITQNFDPNLRHAETGKKISAYQAHEMGIEWAEKMFPDHEVLIATHTDKDHVHNHFVINSSDMATGKKMDMKKNDLYIFQAYNDNITLNHGFGRFESEKYAERDDIRTFSDDLNSKKGIVTHKERVKVAIDEALSDKNILTRSDFEDRLKENGVEPYYFAKNKRIGFKIENEQGEIEFKVGGKKLGKKYGLENIDQKLESNHADRKNEVDQNIDNERASLEIIEVKKPVVTISYEHSKDNITEISGAMKDLPRMLPNHEDSDRSYTVSIHDSVDKKLMFEKNYHPDVYLTDNNGQISLGFPNKPDVLKDIKQASHELKQLATGLEHDPEMQRAKRDYEQTQNNQRPKRHEMDF